MDRQQAARLSPAIQAFKDGKDVQCSLLGKEWHDAPDPSFTPTLRWRVKPPSPIIRWGVKDLSGHYVTSFSTEELARANVAGNTCFTIFKMVEVP